MPSFPRPTCKPGFFSAPIHHFVRLLNRFRHVQNGRMHALIYPGDRFSAVPVTLRAAFWLCALLMSVEAISAEAQTLSFQPTWRQLSPATSPSPRRGATMAYDSAQGQVVLFGGIGSSSGFQNDTWTWNG